ncbi:hypothetical protein [Paenibacillus silagei]|uniref:Exosporium leader peptide n=1 Tax=Paenibacillus silagei TaxID=1670801 RepID=A0ABS4NU05_9BACL|nr:hypothetical protein [Paenibacillus silagei]MBP2113531.1 hypothetical protein [Paenibacillus silagei]
MAAIVDFGKSVPSSFSQSASFPVRRLPNSTILGQFGVSVGTNGLVLLDATVGLYNNTPNASDLIFTIVRNAVQIFTARSSPRSGNSYEAIRLSFTDSGIPSGYYGYALVVSATGTGSPPVIIGPLVFSGLSVS